MLKLSKKVEYALLALQYMSEHPEKVFNAKQLAVELDVSFEFLSKALQSLMKYSLVKSQQGINGGYSLALPPEQITLAEVFTSVEEKVNIVNCTHSDDECERAENCSLKNPMYVIQAMLDNIFLNTTIADLLQYSNFQTVTKSEIQRKNFIPLHNAY